MDQDQLLMTVAQHAGMDEEARRLVVSVSGAVRGHQVLVDVFEGAEPAPYRYWITVRDFMSGQFLTTGNPAANLDEALENIHWGEIGTEPLHTSENW